MSLRQFGVLTSTLGFEFTQDQGVSHLETPELLPHPAPCEREKPGWPCLIWLHPLQEATGN
jgi:hypothetical protein